MYMIFMNKVEDSLNMICLKFGGAAENSVLEKIGKISVLFLCYHLTSIAERDS